jgi:hypothetical protein
LVPGCERRIILDGASELPVGCVCKETSTLPLWLRLFARLRPVIHVYETDGELKDESLLFTVHGTWPFATRWQVFDAEGRAVGILTRNNLLLPGECLAGPIADEPKAFRVTGTISQDYSGRLQIATDPTQTGGEGTLLVKAGAADTHWRQIGRLRQSSAVMRLEFLDETANDPFARMLLIAAVLTLRP